MREGERAAEKPSLFRADMNAYRGSPNEYINKLLELNKKPSNKISISKNQFFLYITAQLEIRNCARNNFFKKNLEPLRK